MTAHRIDVDGTDVFIEGGGPQSLVFIHGWPDTARLWDAQVEALSDRYRCVRFTLPGFEAGSRKAYSFDEVSERIQCVIRRSCPGERVTLVLHDWGCIFGFAVATRYPDLVARVVAADVGDAGSRRHTRELNILAKLTIAAYQLYLATAWRIGGRMGDAMSRLFARVIRAPESAQEIHAGMGYPYAVVWFGMKGGRPGGRPLVPDVPMLFIYGERKPFMLHSAQWASETASKPGSRVVAIGAGHWMMVTRPDTFNTAVISWLEDAC